MRGYIYKKKLTKDGMHSQNINLTYLYIDKK